MSRRQFEATVRAAMRAIPRGFRERMSNVEIVVEDRPSKDLLAEIGHEPGDVLFGLYQGTPLTERSWTHGNTLPDRIVLYRESLQEACADEDELFDEVCLTLIHEAGHYFGLSEEQIQAIEDEFWYGKGKPVGEDTGE
jgi:predicted Zn-dependent protease with MMP-like domain